MTPSPLRKMICPLIKVRVHPPLEWIAVHRTWWISWTYGGQEGVIAAAICTCPALCAKGGYVRHAVLRAELQRALRAAIQREHGILLRSANKPPLLPMP